VGHSGSGKSTIASLLLRFYDKQSGRLLIDGRDIESYPVKHIRDQIAIVMQEPLLFNESIKDNIKYGNPEATNAEILTAATQANCLDFIQSSQDQFFAPRVVAELNKGFSELLDLQLRQYPGFARIREHHQAGRLSTEEIYLLKELLESLNAAGLGKVDTNIETFMVDIVQSFSEKGHLLGHTWESLLMAFVWRVEALPGLEKMLEENMQTLEDSKQGAATRDYLQKNPWRVDTKALQGYLQFLSQRRRSTISPRKMNPEHAKS